MPMPWEWQAGDAEAVDHFDELLKGAPFSKGTELSFTNRKNGHLAVRVGNKEARQQPWPFYKPSLHVKDPCRNLDCNARTLL